jgi:hypothetical protein
MNDICTLIHTHTHTHTHTMIWLGIEFNEQLIHQKLYTLSIYVYMYINLTNLPNVESLIHKNIDSLMKLNKLIDLIKKMIHCNFCMNL